MLSAEHKRLSLGMYKLSLHPVSLTRTGNAKNNIHRCGQELKYSFQKLFVASFIEEQARLWRFSKV